MGKAKKGGGGGGGASKKTQEKKREKIAEDKTFGLKNKNKSKKVQQYIAQVQANVKQGKSQAQLEKEAAQRKKEKELQKQAEKEMALLLGEAYALDKKKAKKKKKKEAEAQKANEEEEQEKQRVADEKDFGMPIAPLRDVFGQGSKVTVERICVELVWKDNLPGKAPGDNSPCLYVKVNDGTTLNPMTMVFLGETPSTFPYKVNMVLDVRNVVAMVRGDKVFLEIPKGAQGTSAPADGVECSVEAASERLSEYIREKIVEEEEIRARGGIPIEERIEEERALLMTKGPLTPVTKERFMEWKEKKKKQKAEEMEAKEKEKSKKGGKQILSGRALFKENQALFVDDDAAGGDIDYTKREELDDTASSNRPSQRFADGEDEGASAKPPAPPDAADAAAIQEKLYLEGDDDLDDLDDLDDDDDDDE